MLKHLIWLQIKIKLKQKQHISCDCKCKFNSAICNSNQKWNNKTCQCECKTYCTWKNDYSWNANTGTEGDEIIIAMNNVSTKKTIATNLTNSASINCHSIKVRYYILRSVLLAIILLSIIIVSTTRRSRDVKIPLCLSNLI